MIIINKIDSAEPEGIAAIEASAKKLNPKATVRTRPLTAERPQLDLSGQESAGSGRWSNPDPWRYAIGAAVVAAKLYGAAELVDPRPWAVGEIAETFQKYPDIGALLPAMGYGDRQVMDLETTINTVECDLVLIGTPISLARIIDIDKPSLRVSYRLAEEGNALVEAVEQLALHPGKEHAA